MQYGEIFINKAYNAIFNNEALWKTTALLIVYDQHGGIYDHVVPPSCTPDDDAFLASPNETGTGSPFAFDRFGVRVPAVLVSPWVPKNMVVPGPYQKNGRKFDHASIPATIMKFILKDFDPNTLSPSDRQKFLAQSRREQSAETFLDVPSDTMQPDDDIPSFEINGGPPDQVNAATAVPQSDARRQIPASNLPQRKAAKTATPRRSKTGGRQQRMVAAPFPEQVQQECQQLLQAGPSTHVARDRWTTKDSLGHFPYAYAIYRFLTDKKTRLPMAISIQAPWGGGKTSLMRMIQAQLDPVAAGPADEPSKEDNETSKELAKKEASATVGHVLRELHGVSESGQTRNREEEKPESPRQQEVNEETKQLEIPLIKGGGERRVTVWFNAWKYESTAQVWAGLADCIVQQVAERLGSTIEREVFWLRLQLRRLDPREIRRRLYEEVFSRFLKNVLPWLWAYVVAPGVSVLFALTARILEWGKWENLGWAGAVAFLCGDLIAAWKQMKAARSDVEKNPARLTLGELIHAPDYTANLGFVHEVVEDLKRVFELIPKQHLPMVCSSTIWTDVLEEKSQP